MPTRAIQKKLQLRTKLIIAAVMAICGTVWAKRTYKNAKLVMLIRRVLGYLVSRILPVPLPRIVNEVGSTTKMPDVLKELGCTKPLIVTDENIIKFGLADKCIESLTAAGCKPAIYKDVVPNPPSELVDEGYEIYKNERCDSLIAFGGGSPMDVAKIIGARVCNPSSVVRDFEGYFMVNFFTARRLPPLIAVPTTAGTGSEATVAAVITLTKERRKIAIADLGLVPRTAVLDANLLVKLPKPVTGATGMDALTHAIESYVSAWSTRVSRELSLKAVEKVFSDLVPSYNDGADLAARDRMLTAAFEAGAAFTRAGVGYVHAIAHQFGALFHTPHGDANAMLLPHVLDFYLEDEEDGSTSCWCTDRLCELARAGGLVKDYDSSNLATKRRIARKFIDRIREMNNALAIPLEVKSMKASDVDNVAKRACREAHGETNGLNNFLAAVFDLGYPVPKYMTEQQCKKIVAKVLPTVEQK